MKKLVRNNFEKIPIVLQYSFKENIKIEKGQFFTIRKIKSDKISDQIFYKPISKVL